MELLVQLGNMVQLSVQQGNKAQFFVLDNKVPQSVQRNMEKPMAQNKIVLVPDLNKIGSGMGKLLNLVGHLMLILRTLLKLKIVFSW